MPTPPATPARVPSYLPTFRAWQEELLMERAMRRLAVAAFVVPAALTLLKLASLVALMG